MPRTHRSIARTLAPLAAVALSVTGCAAIEPLETTGVYEVFTGLSDDPWCGNGDDARLLERGADLMGPHFSISFLCHYAGTEVPEHATEEAERLAELPQLTSGAELLVNQIAFSPTYKPESESGSVAVWVETGAVKIELGALPTHGGYIAVSVPAGEEAVLWVEDEGRAQGLDFRTGEQIEPVTAYYDALLIAPELWEAFEYEDVGIFNNTDAYLMTCGSDFLGADRDIWREDQGWSAEGTVFLKIMFNWCVYDDILWHLDQDAALLAESGEALAKPLSWEVSETDYTYDLQYTAVFVIPADATEVTLHFTPVGDVENLADGDDYAFVETPETTELAVAF